MKKIIISSALVAGLLVSLNAAAVVTTVCAPKTGGGSTITVPDSGTAGTHFMIRPIAPKCSANTTVSGADGAAGAYYAVGSNSVKGKNSFGGHSNGGTVGVSKACAKPGGCEAGEATTAQETALSDGAKT